MARLTLAAVLVLTALAFILPSVQSSNQSQMAEQIAALEERVATLEANHLPAAVPLVQGDASCETDWCIPDENTFRIWCSSQWIRPITANPAGPPVSQDLSECAIITQVEIHTP